MNEKPSNARPAMIIFADFDTPERKFVRIAKDGTLSLECIQSLLLESIKVLQPPTPAHSITQSILAHLGMDNVN